MNLKSGNSLVHIVPSVELSAVFLESTSELKRLPLAPGRKRGKSFWEQFEDRGLVYDVFWYGDKNRVLMVCPPPVNLEPHWQKAVFRALPSGEEVRATRHVLRSTMTIVLDDVPVGSEKIEIGFAGSKFVAPIQPDLTEIFADSKLLFTMNKDNPLVWIKEWARYHQLVHGADAIVIFDNGSREYSLSDIENTLAAVQGIKTILVVSMPHKYGPHDTGVVFHRFWANFLQISSFSILFRRFAGRAFAVLNVDIDEFVDPVEGGNVFDMACKSRDGLFVLEGIWVEDIRKYEEVEGRLPLHTDFLYVLRDFRKKLNAMKWALDPKRDWFADIGVHPGVHRIRNVSRVYAKRAPRGVFWHFKGINTNWKHDRSRGGKFSRFLHRKSDQLALMFRAYKNRQENQAE